MNLSPQKTPPIGELITSCESVAPEAKAQVVADRFLAAKELEALAVVEESRPVGLATRSKLFAILFRRFGFELFGRDPIGEIADPRPLILGENESLDTALNLAMERSFHDIYDEIVVVGEGGTFKGLLSVKRMVLEQGNVLAGSLAQREMALAKAREMKKVTDLKSQFIANVTHELRSPVNAIVGIVELMKMAHGQGSQEQLPEKLSLLGTCAVNLRAIVTNILDLSKIEAGKMDVILEEFDLAELLKEVADTTRVLLGDKPVEVRVEAPEGTLPARTDAVKVRQVLTNLASNAAKFTEKGEIVLAVHREGARVVISVRDTGIGIREEDLERLFSAFTQLEDAKTKKHEGTGLGLTITRQLLGLLQGRISVESTYGRGAAFSINLPIDLSTQGKVANE